MTVKRSGVPDLESYLSGDLESGGLEALRQPISDLDPHTLGVWNLGV